ncbi:Thioredoxin-like fold [Pseudocohnilembus persalinus]|uniref:Thioredoxin-like fold n=1 Tax=Pseudocohnilembus persalinus TaxID=266149 RepID=A0A0V0QNC5_PSEPJ|nr:Thioredoxin-like fold [Pseudocohnilembus persalinus]|eukprot:KRX03787.1 Thioredoxin-like fold [Pseudocohnilembus persalinus]
MSQIQRLDQYDKLQILQLFKKQEQQAQSFTECAQFQQKPQLVLERLQLKKEELENFQESQERKKLQLSQNQQNNSNLQQIDNPQFLLQYKITFSTIIVKLYIYSQALYLYQEPNPYYNLAYDIGQGIQEIKSIYDQLAYKVKKEWESYRHFGMKYDNQDLFLMQKDKSLQEFPNLLEALSIFMSNQIQQKIYKHEFEQIIINDSIQNLHNDIKNADPFLNMKAYIQQHNLHMELEKNLGNKYKSILPTNIKLNPCFSSPLYTDQKDQLCQIAKVSFLQGFVNRIRNKSSRVDLLSSGFGFVIAVSDLEDCMNFLNKNLRNYMEKQLSMRLDTCNYIYQAQQNQINSQKKIIEGLKLVIEDLKLANQIKIDSEVHKKGNNMISDLSILRKNLTDIKLLTFGVEKKIRQQLRNEMLSEFQQIQTLINQFLHKYQEYKDKLTRKVKSDITDIERMLMQEIKKARTFGEDLSQSSLQESLKRTEQTSQLSEQQQKLKMETKINEQQQTILKYQHLQDTMVNTQDEKNKLKGRIVELHEMISNLQDNHKKINLDLVDTTVEKNKVEKKKSDFKIKIDILEKKNKDLIIENQELKNRINEYENAHKNKNINYDLNFQKNFQNSNAFNQIPRNTYFQNENNNNYKNDLLQSQNQNHLSTNLINNSSKINKNEVRHYQSQIASLNSKLTTQLDDLCKFSYDILQNDTLDNRKQNQSKQMGQIKTISNLQLDDQQFSSHSMNNPLFSTTDKKNRQSLKFPLIQNPQQSNNSQNQSFSLINQNKISPDSQRSMVQPAQKRNNSLINFRPNSKVQNKRHKNSESIQNSTEYDLNKQQQQQINQNTQEGNKINFQNLYINLPSNKKQQNNQKSNKVSNQQQGQTGPFYDIQQQSNTQNINNNDKNLQFHLKTSSFIYNEENQKENTIAVFHYNKCSKSRQTIELLKQYINEEEEDYKIKEIYYLENKEIDAETLQDLLKLLKTDNIRTIIRDNEKQYKENNLQSLQDNDPKLFEYIIENPILLQRPIIIFRDQATIGRPPSNALKLIQQI